MLKKLLIAAVVVVIGFVGFNIRSIDSALSHFCGNGVCPYCNKHDRVEARTLQVQVPLDEWFCSRCDAGWPK